MSVFDEVKHAVSMREAAEYYGYTPNRAGAICCPFHDEKTPSMKLYPGAGGFYCFGCGAGGSVVDFVARVFNIDAIEAVRRLNDDFRLNLPLDKPEDRAERTRRQELADTKKQYELWRERTLRQLNNAYRTGFHALRKKAPASWTDGESVAIKMLPVLEDYANTLESEDLKAQMEIFRDREGVERLCQRILNSSLTRSATA